MTQNEFNPYVGPRPFERNQEDTVRFFGRSRETEEIVSLIFGHPVLLVYAQSGAGKTSLFNASITPKLEENGFEVLPLTRVGGVVPQEVALQEIDNLYVFNALLKMVAKTNPRTLLSKSLSTFLEMHTQMAENGQPRPRVIIFDQFEELFTFTPERWREQRDGFFLQIVEALNANPLLRVVFVIREDFLAELDPYARNLPERLRTRYRLELLGEDAALRAIKDPLANTPRKFASGVAEYLVNELLAMRTVDATGKMVEVEGHYVEPVQLQVVCVTLWSSLNPDVTEIQKTHLKDFDVNGALSNFYKSTIEAASKETGVREADLRNWFGKTLITPMGTRSTVFRGEESTGGIENSAVDFLEGRHIIRAEFRAGARWYELTHDRLVEPILANNKKWDEEHSSVLQRQAKLWDQQGRSEGLLLRGQDLVSAESELTSDLTRVEQDFLNACHKLRAQEERERQRNRLITILAVSATIASMVAVFFGIQSNRNEQNAKIALITAQAASTQAIEQQATAQAASTQAIEMNNRAEQFARLGLAHQLVDQSVNLLNNHYDLALLLNIEAYRLGREIPEARGNLLANWNSPNLITFLNLHKDTVRGVDLSPDGKILASGSWDNTIILWDISNPKALTQLSEPLVAHEAAVDSVAFSPDAHLLASSSWKEIILWDVSDPRSPKQLGEPLSGHTEWVEEVAFDPDGRTLASGGSDNTIILWDVSDPRSPTQLGEPLAAHLEDVESVTFSPDGKILASSSDDNTIILWDVSNLQTPSQLGAPLSAHSESVESVAFSPDGKTLASGSSDDTIILWDVSNPKSPSQLGEPLVGHTDDIESVAFSPDGKTLASGSGDNTIILWDVSKPQEPNRVGRSLIGHTMWVTSVAFSPDGKTLVSGSGDKSIRLWEVSNPKGFAQLSVTLSKHTEWVGSVSFSPNGKTLASGGGDLTVRLWDVSEPTSPIQLGDPLTAHSGSVRSVAFSPDGKTLASGSSDDTIILWDVSNPKSPSQLGEPLVGHTDDIESVAFSPDGKTLASGSSDNTIILWDVSDPTLPTQLGAPLSADTDDVESVAFSPNGKTLAFGSSDNRIVLWDVSDPTLPTQLVEPLSAHSESVRSVAFSPDGKTLASGSNDNTVILWDVSNPKSPSQLGVPLSAHPSDVESVAFSPDGKTLASGSWPTVILWDLSNLLLPVQLGKPLIGHMDGVWSVAFSPDGRILASGSNDHTVRLWDIDAESWLRNVCATVGRNLTREEWVNYLPTEEYQVTCPRKLSRVVR